ncbi:MAG TPA: RES family NAD+ phosphorylase [Flavisolibacter sp.]|nr:RES family NAD+ phosphorylase [Flavisolibacter sp.]
MQLFHLGNSRYARQLTGEGARLFGGRWNMKGDACIYTSGTRSLCILEYAANVQLDELPPELSMTEYAIPDNLCRIIPGNDLPADWFLLPAPMSSKLFGSALLSDKDCVCFAVPSAIVPAELNYILNPAADQFSQVTIKATEPFSFDHRIKE